MFHIRIEKFEKQEKVPKNIVERFCGFLLSCPLKDLKPIQKGVSKKTVDLILLVILHC